MIYIDNYDSPMGRITIAGNKEALTGLWFDGQKYFGAALPEQYERGKLPVLEQAKNWLDTYFQGKVPDFTPPLCLRGTPFRRAVWDILLSIPYGGTMTYGQIAQKLAERGGHPGKSARAVGGAVGHNPVSLIVPCHRVVGADGSLTGYAGGVHRKARLLALEKDK